ncbi:hypothetical protein U9M48_044631 [Paspalum notatum var. saurae]|uniref:Auxin-responsive protein n=1 Tax=Paspalum notatum var. saurae TaxID=547442 RepID=A0AAQ3UXH4_PASNO
MEEGSGRERAQPTPQLLNLIRDEREWKAIGEEGGGGRGSSRTTAGPDAAEDSKLELKLGLPGVHDDERAPGPGEKMDEQQQEEESCTALSLGCFPSSPSQSKLAASAATATAGAKRGFLATVGGAKPAGCSQRQQQDREGCGDGLTLGRENMAGERKKGCCPPSSSHEDSAAGLVRSSRGTVPPVVGWPPVRSFRRNLTNVSSSKQSPEQHNDEAGDKAKLTGKRSTLIKINMDGIPIGRKIDLAAYDNYQKLSSAVQDLFRGFLECTNAPKDLACSEIGDQGVEGKIFSGLLDGTGEYTLIYEDNEGGRTLVGGLPWNVFVSTARRLRVMKSSELPHGLIKTASGRADH